MPRRRQAAEGDGLRRGAFRTHQLASQALLSAGVSSAVDRETFLQVDLPVRGGCAHEWRELLCLYLPGMDDACLEVFLGELSKTYPDHHLLVVLDGAPSHRSEQIVHPENISLLQLPPRSPELDPAERWFQEFRRELSNRTFESVVLIQEALTKTLWPYWENPPLLKRLTGYSWWIEAVEEAL